MVPNCRLFSFSHWTTGTRQPSKAPDQNSKHGEFDVNSAGARCRTTKTSIVLETNNVVCADVLRGLDIF